MRRRAGEGRATKESFPAEAKLSDKIAPLMNEHHLLGRPGNSIFLAPPLCITRDEVDHVVSQVDSVISKLEAQL